ncbi:MAG: diaminopimelate epimerase [Bacteroidota bacterium]
MKIDFYKYHGTGNDFIIIEDPDKGFIKSQTSPEKFINLLCNRRFGIGADGLILLQNSSKYDFSMKYYNSDGSEGSMCGNGGRCIAAFAKHKGIGGNRLTFEAIDGEHDVIIEKNSLVKLKMQDVLAYQKIGKSFLINTGSPHYIKFVKNNKSINVIKEGSKIRNDKKYSSEGVNVNFVELKNNLLLVRTFERGVEDETLSCGTGVVASAIAAYLNGVKKPATGFKIITKGGELKVSFSINQQSGIIENVWLKGPAKFVYKGTIDLNDLNLK